MIKKKKNIRQYINNARFLSFIEFIKNIARRSLVYCVIIGLIIFAVFSSNGNVIRYKFGEYVEYVIYNKLSGLFSHFNDKFITKSNSIQIPSAEYYAKIQELEAENIKLKNMMRIVEGIDYNVKIGKVMGYSDELGANKFFVAVENPNDIGELSAVFTENGLIGRVVSRSLYGVWVMAIYDIHSRVPVITLANNKKGILYGTGKVGQCILRHLEGQVFDGESVVTLMYKDAIPYGIIVGSTSLNNLSNEIKNEVPIISKINWSDLKYVMIINAQPDSLK